MEKHVDVMIIGINRAGRYVVQQILPGYKKLVCTALFAGMCSEVGFVRRKEWQEQEA